MLPGRKRVDEANKNVVVEGTLHACFEALDRTADLEALIRSNLYPVVVSDDPDAVEALDKGNIFLQAATQLRAFRRDLVHSESRLDASLHKVAAVCDADREQLAPIDGWFVRQRDTAISNHSDVFDPNSSEAVRDLSSNYLMKEKQFPYGDVFDEQEVQLFFSKLRNALTALIRGCLR